MARKACCAGDRERVCECCALVRNPPDCTTELMDMESGLHRQVGRAAVVFGEGLDAIR